MSGYRRHTKALIMGRITATIISTVKALEPGILLLGMAVVDITAEAVTLTRAVTPEFIASPQKSHDNDSDELIAAINKAEVLKELR
jgi:hypothetical protein